MLNAAALIDPENDTIAKKIIRIRDEFMKDLILRLEDEIKKDFPDKCNDAEKLMITNQMAKAGKLVEQINLEEPNSARAFYVKGLLLYYKGDLKESFKLFKQASDLNPRMENAVRMRKKVKSLQELVDAATKEMNDKNYPKSIELFTKIIDTDKNNKLISQASHFHRALAYFNYGNFEESFEDYKSSEILKSVVGDVLKNIGTKGLKKKPEADDVKAINSSNIEKQKG